MKQTITLKLHDQTGMSAKEKAIFEAGLVNVLAFGSYIEVVSKGEGGEGTSFSPLETEADGAYVLTMIYQESLEEELAEALKESLERRVSNYVLMCDLAMEVEIVLS